MLICVAYYDVAEHDIEWAQFGELFDDYRHELSNSRKEYHLSLGLAHLRGLFEATTFDDRR